MKTLFFTLMAVIGCSFASFSQVATTQTKMELNASKSNGKYVFMMPAGLNKDDVMKNAAYYVHYFTVGYNEKSGQAKVDMVNNDEKSRRVILRFLMSCGVRSVVVEGQTMNLEDFYSTHLQ
jgi:hypothetical protein